jgi:hypothetical protein
VDGQTYYLNDSDQYAQLGATAHDGCLAAVLSGPSWEVVHAAKGCRDKMETVYALSLADNGKTRIGITRRFYGTDFEAKNKFFSELPPEERRRYFQEIVSGVAQGARAVGDLTTSFNQYPGLEQFTVEVDHYAVVDGKYLYFDLPFSPSLFPTGADRRMLPLFLSREGERTVRTEINLPPEFRHLVIAPKTEEIEAPCGGGRARITSESGAGKYVITHDFETAPAIVPPKDYAALLKVGSTLGKKGFKTFLLEAE